MNDIAKQCEVNIEEFRTGKIIRLGKFDKERAKRPLLIQCDDINLTTKLQYFVMQTN